MSCAAARPSLPKPSNSPVERTRGSFFVLRRIRAFAPTFPLGTAGARAQDAFHRPDFALRPSGSTSVEALDFRRSERQFRLKLPTRLVKDLSPRLQLSSLWRSKSIASKKNDASFRFLQPTSFHEHSPNSHLTTNVTFTTLTNSAEPVWSRRATNAPAETNPRC